MVVIRDGSAVFVSSRHVVGLLRSGRMVTSVAVCQFARDLENIHGVVMEWVVNFGGSSRSRRIVTSRHILDMATTRHNLDGWCRSVSICLFARDLENILGVLWSEVEMSADRPVRDGSRRTVTNVKDEVGSCPFVSLRETYKMVMVVLWSGVIISADRD